MSLIFEDVLDEKCEIGKVTKTNTDHQNVTQVQGLKKRPVDVNWLVYFLAQKTSFLTKAGQVGYNQLILLPGCMLRV